MTASLFKSWSHPRLLALGLAVLLAAEDSGAATPPPATIQVPAGFEVVRIATPPLVEFPMLGCFDDRGRLFVGENAGVNLDDVGLEKALPNRIKLLEDLDGDGVFDRATVFADKMTFPQGALWHDGALLVASPPSIWRLEDTNGDGVADKRSELVTGFRYNGNAADVHGPFLHPNGRIYWCHGRRAHEVYERDGTFVSKGTAARIWSSRPDGTDIQIHAGGGLNNPTLLAFTQEGDIIGTANMFHRAPRGDALVHWIHGGVYPRADDESTIGEFKRTGDLLGAVIPFAHVVPVGLTFARHPSWEPAFRGNLFLAQFDTRVILRVPLERSGATYRAHPEVFASTNDASVHFTDMLEDADGSLLVIDTGAWFKNGCTMFGTSWPNVTGGIYRIRRRGAPTVPDSRGQSIAWARLSPAEAVAYLADPRPVVRDRAVTEVARKGQGAIAALQTALSDPRTLMRSNAVWALTRIGTADAQTAVRGTLNDAEAGIRQAACQGIFQARDQDAFKPLLPLLADHDAAVRREAARALGRLRNPAALDALADAIAAVKNDAVLLHALIYALIEIDAPAETRMLLNDRRPAVRRAALIALDQLPNGNLAAEPVFAALRGPEAELRAAALPIALRHAAWGREAAAYLDWAAAETRDPNLPPIVTRLLATFLPRVEVRDWLRSKLVSSAGTPAIDLRIVVEAIGNGRGTWDEAWRAPLLAALRAEDAGVAQLALRAMATHRTRDFTAALKEAAHDRKRSAAFRVSALQAAAGGDKAFDDDGLSMLMETFAAGRPGEDRVQAAFFLAGVKLSRAQLITLAGVVPSAGPVELPHLLNAYGRGPTDPEIGVALLAALRESSARWTLDAAAIYIVFRRYPPPAADNAGVLIAEIVAQAAVKERQLVDLERRIAAGDAARGQKAFAAGAGACVSCHRVGDLGGKIGPDLSTIGRIRGARELLESIAYPNATIAQGYESIRIQTSHGQDIVGSIVREGDAEIVLATSDSREITLPRAAVTKRELIATSLMPAGLDQALGPEALADLVAFLMSQR